MRHDIKEKFIFSIIGFVFIFSILYLLIMPHIALNGSDKLQINVGEEYQDPGFQATQFFFNKNKSVKVQNHLDNQKVGQYNIVYTLKIGHLTAKAIRMIEVVDREKPAIHLQGSSYVCPNKEYIEEGYEVLDNYDGNITHKVAIKKYKDKIIYTIKDSSNNESKVIRTIQTGDIESPKIVLKGEENIVLNLGTVYEEQGVVVTDNCDDEISDKLIIDGQVDINKVGQYIVTYSVTDSSGNSTAISRTIHVVNPNNHQELNGIGKIIYLTFDDGPSYSITPSLLQILKEENVKATFFVINHDDKLNYLIKQAYDDGHTIALHSFSHNYEYIYSSIDHYFSDLEAIQSKVGNIIGVKPIMIRFPGGSSNTISRKYNQGIMTILTDQVVKKGYVYFDWNISSEDAGGARNSTQVYHNVVNHLVYKNNVVLLHDFESNYKMLNAIRDIIKFGKEHGYTFQALTINSFSAHHSVNN